MGGCWHLALAGRLQLNSIPPLDNRRLIEYVYRASHRMDRELCERLFAEKPYRPQLCVCMLLTQRGLRDLQHAAGVLK